MVPIRDVGEGKALKAENIRSYKRIFRGQKTPKNLEI
jgi:hypothetical protein